VKRAAKTGLGFTVVSKLAVADELKHNSLKEIKVFDVDRRRRFYVVNHLKRTLANCTVDS
jgi:DNA-binding transcriptional LysR family regulator